MSNYFVLIRQLLAMRDMFLLENSEGYIIQNAIHEIVLELLSRYNKLQDGCMRLASLHGYKSLLLDYMPIQATCLQHFGSVDP